MNKEWSDKNKAMQALLKKNTMEQGISELIELRDILMKEIDSWNNLPEDTFSAIPYINTDGYHSKTVAYSLWHIFRIEDIVVNSLIRRCNEVLSAGDYAARMNASIITTGNELKGMQIAEFSQRLNISVLYEYVHAVKSATDDWLKTISYDDLKTTFTNQDKERLAILNVVDTDEEAVWLIDYWCGKDIKGLIKMPLSRHWIMHIEAANRIIAKCSK